MSDRSHRKINILPVTAAVLLCLCLLSFTRVGSVYGRLTDEEGTPSEYATDSDASRYFDYSKAIPSEVETIEVESTIIEIPEPDPIEGYEFLGWNTCEDGSGDWYFPGELFEMTEECTDFYAIWEKILKATPSQAVKAASGSDAIPAGGGGALAAPAAAQPAETAPVIAETSAVPEEITEVAVITEEVETSAGDVEVTEVEETMEVSETEVVTETVETGETTEVAETVETETGTEAETDTEASTEAESEVSSTEAETEETSPVVSEEVSLGAEPASVDETPVEVAEESMVEESAEAPETPEA